KRAAELLLESDSKAKQTGNDGADSRAKEPEKGAEKQPNQDQVAAEVVAPGAASTKSGASSQAISVPKGAGTIEGMGESFSAQLSTGIATFTVPFSLPAARGTAQPSLSLSYSSSGGWGVAGQGWDLGVPFIARQTDRGAPRYGDQSDYFDD